MTHALFSLMKYRQFILTCPAVVTAGILAFAAPAFADEKRGMPDLCQIDQTCLPTSTANLILWFGRHGYPNLIQKGDTQDESELRTVHKLMAATDARFDTGTQMENVTSGIKKYIEDCGYACTVEYRGLAHGHFTQEWLNENNDPNKGFILLLSYCTYTRSTGIFNYACNFGHAVTLVNSEPKMILVHDPAHYDDEPGRKILTPEVLTGGTFSAGPMTAPVAGLMVLSGSLLDAPPESLILLSGAVGITMLPAKAPGSTPDPAPAGGPKTLAGDTGSSSSAPSSVPLHPKVEPDANEGWLMALYHFLSR